MVAFLIARLPAQPISLEVIEFMQKNGISFRLSTNAPLMNVLMTDGLGDDQLIGFRHEFEPEKEDVDLLNEVMRNEGEEKVLSDQTDRHQMPGEPIEQTEDQNDEHEDDKEDVDADENAAVKENNEESIEDEEEDEEIVQVKPRQAAAPVWRLLFTCLVKNCPSSFRTFKELEEHAKIHSNKDIYFCDVCKKNFSSKEAAMEHIQERKKKDCCECGKHFEELLRHLRCHTGEKPFVCATCGRAFSLNGDLKSHETTQHSGEKNHVCDVCFTPFALKKSLESHTQKVHSKKKMYECDQCDYKISMKYRLERHIEKYHK